MSAKKRMVENPKPVMPREPPSAAAANANQAVCRKCKKEGVEVFQWRHGHSGRTVDFRHCKECLASSFCSIDCFFCDAIIGYQFGFEYPGDGDDYRCCKNCRHIIK